MYSEALGPGGVGLMTGWFSDYAPVKALAVLGGLFLIQLYYTFNLPQEACRYPHLLTNAIPRTHVLNS